MTDTDRLGELLQSQIGALPSVRSNARAKGTTNVTFTIEGGRDDLPSHVHRIADRFDQTVVHRRTEKNGLGETESVFEVVDDDRLHTLDRHVEQYDSTANVVTDGGTTDCGRRSCDRNSVVGFSAGRGGTKARCAVHALADGVDGVGESRAEDILDAIALDELVERVDGADGTHAPPVLSRIDGLGPTSAASIAENIDQSAVATAVREEDR